MSYVADGYVASGYIGQPGSRAMFQLGAQTLNFEQSPLRPPLDLEEIQAEFESAGGRHFALDPIAEEQVMVLRWPRAYSYYADRLIDWFYNIAEGMANSFTYRDKDDNTFTVRIATAELPEVREVRGGRFELEVPLLVLA